MAKKVHPAPANFSASNGKPASPLHPSEHEKPNTSDARLNKCSFNSTKWTETARFAATSCCATSGGLGDYVLESSEPSNTCVGHGPPWMDYLWLCEGDGKGRRNKKLSRRTRLFLQQQPSGSREKLFEEQIQRIDPTLLEKDYTRLHEEFFEALLKEQGQQVLSTTPKFCASGTDRVLKKSESRDTCSSVSSGLSTTSMGASAATSAISTSLPSTTSVQTLRKKHDPLQLYKLAPIRTCGGRTPNNQLSPESSRNHVHRARVPPIEAYSQMYGPAAAIAQPICLEDIMAKDYLQNPGEYVHPHCLLQKDKGRGDRLKSSVSATGKELCLKKLRDKIRLVLQVASPTVSMGMGEREAQLSRKSTSGTGMKRRLAKLSEVGLNYVETRSMLEFQLGFLSMQYGLLIHWDTVKTGKIVFICLRKMCHDSFYTKIPDLLTEPTLLLQQQQQLYPSNCHQRQSSLVSETAKQEPAPPLVVRSTKGNHAIYPRQSGSTEVVLVDAPYRVPQPEVFAPSVLTVDICAVTGLDHRRSQWTLSMTFAGHTEIADLKYNPQTKSLETTRTNPCQWEMVPNRHMTSFDMAGLEIRLFEQRGGIRGVGRKILGKRDSNVSGVSSIRCSRSRSSSFALDKNNVTGSKQKIATKLTSRLASTMTMPLGGLVSQPSTSQTTRWKLTIPFTHDDVAHVTLTLAHQSEYSNWLYNELRARRKEEFASTGMSMWQPSLLKRLVLPSHDESLLGVGGAHVMDYQFDEEENCEEHYLSDWFCGFCYLFPLSTSGECEK